MADSSFKRLAVQTSHYSVTSLFNMVAGLITFPFLTRVFTIDDYGAMNLVAATLTVSVAFGKVGIQHSILRYHSEISAGKSRYTLPQLFSTTLFGMLATSLLVMVVVGAGTQLVPGRWLGDQRLRVLFAIASTLIVVQVVESSLVNVLRAEQLTSALMKYQVLKKYLALGCIVFALLMIAPSLPAFYGATVLSETVALAVLAWLLFRGGKRPRPSLSEFSRPLYREMLGFGIPMMIGYELSGIVLSVGDRYVIEGMLGEGPLGLYSAAYNLCQYVQAIVIVSVGQAIVPMYMRMFDEKGVEETSAFIARSLKTYALFGAPVVAGLAAIGPYLLPSLASQKYASAAVILPWVIAGMMIEGANSMLGAGLFIFRRTRTIMIIVLSCAILNIALNLVLVPRIGILGAAIATLVSYAGTSLGLALAGRRLLPVALPWATLARSGAAAGLMYLTLIHVYSGHRLATAGVRIALGALIYVVVVGIVDPDARQLLDKVRRKLVRG